MILCKEEYAKDDRQGRVPRHPGRAAYACYRRQRRLRSAKRSNPRLKTYQQNIVKNAKALADGLIKCGFDLVSGGTDNHLMLVDLRSVNLTGKEMEHRLDEVYITVNKNAIPFDPQKPFVTSGIRIGTPAATTRGFDEADFREIAKLIYMTATQYPEKADDIRAAVTALCDKHPLYQ